MGAAGSTRRVSVRNEEPRIISVSEEVIKRLRSQGGQRQTLEAGETRQEMEPKQPSNVPSIPQYGGIINVGNSGYPVIETVTALQVRQEKDNELRDNDMFWSNKLKDLEARYISSAFVAEEEFSTELEKLDKLIPKPRTTICTDLATKVSQCYTLNNTQTLKCSGVVKEFSQCVERHTLKLLAPSG